VVGIEGPQHFIGDDPNIKMINKRDEKWHPTDSFVH